MDKNSNKPSYAVPTISQYRLLNALIYNSEYCNDSRITEDIFPNETAKSLYLAIMQLHTAGYNITRASLLQTGASIDYNVTESIINKVFDVDEGTDNLDDILKVLKTEKQREFLKTRLDALREQLDEPGDLDFGSITGALYDMEGFTNVQDTDSPLMTFDDWTETYVEDLEERKEGRFYSYGDELLDRVAKKGAYPGAITVCAASTSMGKSAFALNLVNGHINTGTPCMYLSLEMSAIDTMDRLVALRCNIPEGALYDTEDGNIDAVMDRVLEEKEALKNNNKFFFSEETNVDINKLRAMIREFKQRTHEEYCFVVIDLLTQMKNFMSPKNGMSVPAAMEVGMNELNALAKEENVHIFGIAQFNRASDDGKPYSIKDIDKLRPSISSVKNSGALAERARVLLSIFRPKYYADKYLQDDEEAKNMEDIMEITVLKNSSGKTGLRLKYKYESEFYRCLPIKPEEEAAKKERDILANINY